VKFRIEESSRRGIFRVDDVVSSCCAL